MFIPSAFRIEVKPLGKDSIIIDDKQELVELGEIVSIGSNANYISNRLSRIVPNPNKGFWFDRFIGIHDKYVKEYMDEYYYKVGDILAFEGWGATKISYKGEDRWVVSTDKNVILGKFTKE